MLIEFIYYVQILVGFREGNLPFVLVFMIPSDLNWVFVKQYCFHLCFCHQAMYDAIQKLDKKFDLLHWKVSEMQHTRVKPLLLKPVSSKGLWHFSFNSFTSSVYFFKNPFLSLTLKLVFHISYYIPVSVSYVVINQLSQIGQWPPSNLGCCDKCCKILFVSARTEINCVG